MDVHRRSKHHIVVPGVRVWLEGGPTIGQERVFTESFCIGRGDDCAVKVEGSMVSRKHVEVVFEGETWWVRDLGSSNGTYCGNEKVKQIPVENDLQIRLGKDGPSVYFGCMDSLSDKTNDSSKFVRSESRRGDQFSAKRPKPSRSSEPETAVPVVGPPGGKAEDTKREGRSGTGDSSVSQVIRHYFGDQSGAAGEHTMMIRRAYDEVQRKHKRKYIWIIGGVLGLFLIATVAAVYQYLENQRLERAASELFYDLRAFDLENARIMRALAASGQDVSVLIDREDRQRLISSKRNEYDAYVEELGLRRRLQPDERLIHRMAFIFNESEFAIPATFVREVREGIKYWQQAGSSFDDVIREAEDKGYIEQIVRTLQKYGLPPHFFYLALVESRLDPEAVGTPTNYGYAKGMWQFIPGTAEAYGLKLGPLWRIRQFDQLDERHDFVKSTDAAARYLLDIYSTLAHASGLLVMASYNWGERRIAGRLDRLEERLPGEVAREALSGIPEDTNARTYWNFYGEYQEIMPAETKDYVIRIFSAAVIGENPQMFGFSVDNPLKKYLETYDDSGQ